eukprot:938984-Amphidinium_carterae.1
MMRGTLGQLDGKRTRRTDGGKPMPPLPLLPRRAARATLGADTSHPSWSSPSRHTPLMLRSVSYTHLRAHETEADL